MNKQTVKSDTGNASLLPPRLASLAEQREVSRLWLSTDCQDLAHVWRVCPSANSSAVTSSWKMIELCTDTNNVPVHVHTGINTGIFYTGRYSDWCGQVCRPSVCSPQVTKPTIRDGRASMHWHLWGASRKFDNFAYVDWRVCTDLISLWHLRLGCTQFHVCPPCWWDALSLQGTSALSVPVDPTAR